MLIDCSGLEPPILSRFLGTANSFKGSLFAFIEGVGLYGLHNSVLMLPLFIFDVVTLGLRASTFSLDSGSGPRGTEPLWEVPGLLSGLWGMVLLEDLAVIVISGLGDGSRDLLALALLAAASTSAMELLKVRGMAPEDSELLKS